MGILFASSRQIQEYCLGGDSWSTVGPLASALQEGPKPYSCLSNQQRGSPSWKNSTRHSWKGSQPCSLAVLLVFQSNPNPHIQGKHMNKTMAPKLPNLPCFEAFGVVFCPHVCSYFCLVCGGGGGGGRGVTSVSLN